MFGGTLGIYNTSLVELELKDDAKPVFLRPCPVPRVHGDVFKRESKLLVSLVVLEHANYFEWGTLPFDQ